MDNTENKELFLSTFRKNVQRPGAEKLLAWMETTDFFTAPASTRFHAAYEGGLLDHSMNVYNVLISKHFDPASDDIESSFYSNSYSSEGVVLFKAQSCTSLPTMIPFSLNFHSTVL